MFFLVVVCFSAGMSAFGLVFAARSEPSCGWKGEIA